MNAFLAELGKRTAERWLTLLVLPGALFVAVTTAGVLVLGHGQWYDVAALVRAVDEAAGQWRSTGQVLTLVVALLLGASGAGLTAQALGSGIERLWLASDGGAAGRWLTGRRRLHWSAADTAYRSAVLRRYAEGSADDLDALLAVRNRVCLVEPGRPTWMADRLHAAGERIHRTYDLDFASAWPRLWLCVPDAARAELMAARGALSAETRLFGWGLLYVVPAVWWWPSAVVGVLTCVVAWRRGRAATTALAELAESSVDLYGRDLAGQLGLACPERLTPEIGLAITRILRKDG